MLARTTTSALLLALWSQAAGAASIERAEALFAEARQLALRNRNRMNGTALAKVESAVRELEEAVEAGAEAGWKALSELAWAAERSREDMGDHGKSLDLARRMIRCDRKGGRHREARLQMALTYRAMRDFEKAQETYDSIVAAKAGDRVHVLLPVAEMVYLEVGERERGRKLLDEALMNKDVSNHARYRFVLDRARHAVYQGRRDEALEWYAMAERMPDEKEKDRLRYLTQALHGMGKVEEGLGRSDRAKALYRRAMDLEGGDMRYRALARDAIEDIEYFE